MESRQSPHPSPRNYDNVQQYLFSHSSIFSTYLTKAAAPFEHIGEVFANNGRLFFENSHLKSVNDELLDMVVELVNNHQLLSHFEKRLIFWKPLLDEKSIKETRHTFRQYYFSPIENSVTYKAFIDTQRKKMHGLGNADIKHIHNQIAGAIIFRIASAWKEHNPEKLSEKIGLLTKILNYNASPQDLSLTFEKNLSLLIENELQSLQMEFKQTKIAKKLRLEKIGQALVKIQSSFLYEGFNFAYITLCLSLTLEFKKIQGDKDTNINRYAEAIFIHFIHSSKAYDETSQNLILLIRPYLKKSSLKKYQDIFAQLSIEDSTKPMDQNTDQPIAPKSKSGSFLSGLLPSFSKNISPRQQDNAAALIKGDATSPSELPLTSIIKVPRVNLMRRRASSPALFTPNERQPQKSSRSALDSGDTVTSPKSKK